MPPLTSRSAATRAERPQLAPTWQILTMVVIVCLALWLLYPRQDLEKRLARSGETALSIAYLDNLLRSDPDNPQLRLLLAQRP